MALRKRWCFRVVERGPMSFPRAKLITGALAAMLFAATPVVAFAERGSHAVGGFFKFLGVIKGQTREIDAEAMDVYESTSRSGSCAERRERLLAILPDALRFSRYARDIAHADHGSEMKAAGVKTLDLGDGRSAYSDGAGQRYAEARVDPERHQAVVIFRGTRLSSGSDISTDVLSFIGLQTGYYAWASSLVAQVVREHPGMAVVVTGESLGGGLTLYAVLHNPGVSGFAFNPAGLSLLTWATTRSSERARTNAAVTVISTRSADHIEPVTAISLAGRSVLPGHIFVVETGAFDALTLHSAKTVVAALEHTASTDAEGSVCDGDLGVLAN